MTREQIIQRLPQSCGSGRRSIRINYYKSGRIMRRQQSGRRAPANLDGLDIAIIGRACRLPGANSAGELWDLLSAGRCTVSRIPPDRWPLELLAHPRLKERGRSYSWAAGVLDDVWVFDPAVF